MNEHLNRKLKGTSFVILFIVLTIVLFFTLTNRVAADGNDYKTIAVEKGDTLWSLAQRYHSSNSGLSEEAFVNWIERENGIDRNFIQPDQKLIIPVRK
ncbi:LysM peptidoglycan-binding domain-containing protein [Sporolactobacillus sp. CQH2019]|uniref:cell division suppressor protein YneA n=1 Tax=Sporolactobacillus sp. CQH2019 TaxID=3023512 RepID=UPI002367DF7E|nr:LysM peptidoglycan-binding domain-containing protein [Sporolactobacillus sp. CQH2019]MDD9149552.1 LysM peptidoglycan-binding domain-containing protein [Sporolactobacillus sp. CQH2019]